MSDRSNSAMAPMIWNMRRPEGVLKVQIVAEADEGHAIGTKIRESVDQMLQRTTEAVDFPNQHGIELPPVSVGHQLVQLWSRFL